MNALVPNSLTRIIELYELLLTEGEVDAREQALKYDKSVETIKRDIKAIRNALPNGPDIRYDRIHKIYRMERDAKADDFFLNFMMLIILYGSRSLQKEELNKLAGKIFDRLDSSNRRSARKVTESYAVNYVPMIDKELLPLIRVIFDCILEQRVLQFEYTTSGMEKTEAMVAPLSIAYDRGFFYMIASKSLNADHAERRNYRIDRMQRPRKLRRGFAKEQSGSGFFEAGRYYNQSYLMHSGSAEIEATIRIKPSIAQYLEPAFPTHRLIREEDGCLVYKVTVAHEDSLLFWLLPQRTWAEVLAPQSLRNKLKETIADMARLYGDD
ncbi:YafY family protein [Cohnella sp. GbtcB17]|uniref:helix-turn-helix transcriptional regulator n=1 Tax=Cohnella sp. GbtcB17 TaxID=2824762 RepID=UPI001C306C71|nr:WYL domain-containing protein [Cohnella sp. GbtcB17]